MRHRIGLRKARLLRRRLRGRSINPSSSPEPDTEFHDFHANFDRDHAGKHLIFFNDSNSHISQNHTVHVNNQDDRNPRNGHRNPSYNPHADIQQNDNR